MSERSLVLFILCSCALQVQAPNLSIYMKELFTDVYPAAHGVSHIWTLQVLYCSRIFSRSSAPKFAFLAQQLATPVF